MLIPSQVHHNYCHHESLSVLPDSFGLICWNVYKKNRLNDRFRSFMQKEIEKKKIDFLLFQEASFKADRPCLFEGFAFDAAANIEYRRSFYGVLTASRTVSKEARAFLSESKEAFFATRKSFLLTNYRYEDGSELLIVNIHAINFRENRSYNKETDRLLELLSVHIGPMIVAGDFNTWNQKRVTKLSAIRKALGLAMVPYGKDESVKSMFGNHLDFIFYRGLELLAYEVLEEDGISDHNPLFARFRKK